ncbi:unnamed protein product [Haemonchus placei]|uniref:Transposase n=1 Tax=Haemonchus placei TaxID=6290 RepID=A0A0N4X3F6_HAEPC|nr:unnamed protein product [Haemonchus placei]
MPRIKKGPEINTVTYSQNYGKGRDSAKLQAIHVQSGIKSGKHQKLGLNDRLFTARSGLLYTMSKLTSTPVLGRMFLLRYLSPGKNEKEH